MDFAKLVDIFDEHGVTFVSVTQSFNTTTSMGRLTLNVLLSFAQFEREVSAERIRDKIAASKKKGMWMGGRPPIGYEAVDKKLIVHREDAQTTLYIFERYLSLGTVEKLKRELDKQGFVSKQHISKRGNKIGGKPYSRGALYSILQNPIYIGKIRHKDKTYDGQHEAIITQELWNNVQKKLSDQSVVHRGHKKAGDPNLLKGLLFDTEGTPYSPAGTKKKSGQVYRYYISQSLIQYKDHPKGTMARIPAHEVEKIISDTIRAGLVESLTLDPIDDHHTIQYITESSISIEALITESVNTIKVDQARLDIDVDPTKIRQMLQTHLKLDIPERCKKTNYILSVSFTLRRTNRGAIILKPDNKTNDFLDMPPTQLKNLIRGIVWRDEHFAGTSMKEIAEREGLSKAGVQKIVMGSLDTLLTL